MKHRAGRENNKSKGYEIKAQREGQRKNLIKKNEHGVVMTRAANEGS